MRFLLTALLVGCGSGTVVLDDKVGGADSAGGDDTAAASEGGGGEGGSGGGSGGDTAGGGEGGDPPPNAAMGTYLGERWRELPEYRWECRSDLELTVDALGGFEQDADCTMDLGRDSYDFPFTLRGLVSDAGALSGKISIDDQYLGTWETGISGTAVDGALEYVWETTVELDWGGGGGDGGGGGGGGGTDTVDVNGGGDGTRE